MSENESVAQLLVLKGADVNATNEDGQLWPNVLRIFEDLPLVDSQAQTLSFELQKPEKQISHELIRFWHSFLPHRLPLSRIL